MSETSAFTAHVVLQKPCETCDEEEAGPCQRELDCGCVREEQVGRPEGYATAKGARLVAATFRRKKRGIAARVYRDGECVWYDG